MRQLDRFELRWEQFSSEKKAAFWQHCDHCAPKLLDVGGVRVPAGLSFDQAFWKGGHVLDGDTTGNIPPNFCPTVRFEPLVRFVQQGDEVARLAASSNSAPSLARLPAILTAESPTLQLARALKQHFSEKALVACQRRIERCAEDLRAAAVGATAGVQATANAAPPIADGASATPGAEPRVAGPSGAEGGLSVVVAAPSR
mmetsp:Transcript_126131/g.403659  ORF Transcript_126131/g.403659 Transcript_126131/m.403659 type:complete len:200 (+) Transcript_126131:361-960(+)